MRHSLRLATGAPEQRAEHEKGSGKFREEGLRPRAAPRGGEGRQGAKGGGPEAGAPAPSPARPADAGSQRTPARGGQRVTYLPTVWLASWRIRLNCFFIVVPLARYPGSWGGRSSPEPAAGLHGSRAEPPGRRRRHCGASGAVWPRAHLPPGGSTAYSPCRRGAGCRILLLTRAAAPSSQRPGRPGRRRVRPGFLPPAQLRRGTRVSAGWLAGGRGSPLRLCGGRRAFWDL